MLFVPSCVFSSSLFAHTNVDEWSSYGKQSGDGGSPQAFHPSRGIKGGTRGRREGVAVLKVSDCDDV